MCYMVCGFRSFEVWYNIHLTESLFRKITDMKIWRSQKTKCYIYRWFACRVSLILIMVEFSTECFDFNFTGRRLDHFAQPAWIQEWIYWFRQFTFHLVAFKNIWMINCGCYLFPLIPRFIAFLFYAFLV